MVATGNHCSYIKKAIAPVIRKKGSPIGGPKPMSAGEKLACALWWMAKGGEYPMVGSAANNSRSSIHRCVRDVCKAINSRLARKHIKFPKTPEQLAAAAAALVYRPRRSNANSNASRVIRGLPQIIGAVDDTQIPIFKPPNSADEYYNRKKQLALLMQGVVNANGRFIDVYTGWSGRLHDARMFTESPLRSALQAPNGSQLQTQLRSRIINIGGQRVPYVLIADSAYGASLFVLPGFKHSTTLNSPRRRKFNKKHARTRNVVERACGRLKQRWRVLLKPMKLTLKNTVRVIITCCVLHNICDEFKCMPDPEDPEFQAVLAEYQQQYPAAAAPPAASNGGSTRASDVGKAMRDGFVQWVKHS